MKMVEMKDGKQYVLLPDENFIKLPDGTIINVAHVRFVDRDNDRISDDNVRIYTGGEGGWQAYYDPDGKIYEYFNSMAQEVGI